MEMITDVKLLPGEGIYDERYLPPAWKTPWEEGARE